MSNAASDAAFEPVGHTVIVVHGTFAAPERNQQGAIDRHRPVNWYLPEGAFCRGLDAIWTEHDAPWRCWAHGGPPFVWSGANSWTERVWAGNELGLYIKSLIGQRWRCAVVAHSHGGNVLLHALDRLSDQERAELGPVCFVGTPFYEFEGATPGLLADRTVQRNRPYLWGAIALCILSYLHAWTRAWHVTPIEQVVVTVLSIFGAMALALEIRAGFDSLNFDLEFGPGALPEDARRNDMLVLHTAEDEALRFLDSMVDERNPLGNLASGRFHVLAAVVAGFRTAVEVDRIRFPPWNTLAGCTHAPLRLFVLVKVFLSTIGQSFIGSIFQSRLWTTLREYALGVSGCPLSVSRVMYLPKYWSGPNAFPVTWTLDATALQESRSARSRSVHLVASLLSAPGHQMKGSELIGLLKDLFTNIDLVHAAYYSRDGGIRQVAAWIEMSPEEKQIRSTRSDIVSRIEFAGYATDASLRLAGYGASDLADDRAALDALEERERHLLTTLSKPARDAFEERTRNSFHPYPP